MNSPPKPATNGWLLLLATGLAILALTALGTPALRMFGDNAFIGLALLSGALTLVATRLAGGLPTREAITIILAIGLALRLIVLPVEPLLSNDVYRYVWDGRVQGLGINPYRYVPADPALAALRDEAIFLGMNRADYAVTIYPPVAQVFFFLVTRLGESVTVMKAALVGTEAVTVAVTIGLLRRLGRPATLVVAYLWHPLPVWEIANNGHVDALMIALMMLGIWIAVRGWALRGALVVAMAALVKPFAILVLPALWRLFDWRMPALVLTAAAAAYLPYLSVGAGVLGFLTTGYVSEERIDSGDGFWALVAWRAVFDTRSGDVAVYGALALLVLGGLALRAASRRERTAATVLSDVNVLVLAFLFFLSPNFPWYFLMATPFLALVGGTAGWVATIGAFILSNDAVPGDLHIPFELRDAAFNILFVLAVLLAWAGKWSALRRPAGA